MLWFIACAIITIELQDDDIGFWKSMWIFFGWPMYLGQWIKRNFEK